MREIKFRAWDTNQKKWLFGKEGFSMFGEIVIMGEWGAAAWKSISEDELGRYILRRHTGLYDKNDLEIYEGDIVKTVTHYYGDRNERNTVIEWIDDMQDDSFGEPFSTGYRIYGGEWEVIGNIYENPELLEKTK